MKLTLADRFERWGNENKKSGVADGRALGVKVECSSGFFKLKMVDIGERVGIFLPGLQKQTCCGLRKVWGKGKKSFSMIVSARWSALRHIEEKWRRILHAARARQLSQ